jgi:hypothetical protein
MQFYQGLPKSINAVECRARSLSTTASPSWSLWVQDTQRFKRHYATTSSIISACLTSHCALKLNPVEPPRYATRMPGGVGGVALRGVPPIPISHKSLFRHRQMCMDLGGLGFATLVNPCGGGAHVFRWRGLGSFRLLTLPALIKNLALEMR